MSDDGYGGGGGGGGGGGDDYDYNVSAMIIYGKGDCRVLCPRISTGRKSEQGLSGQNKTRRCLACQDTL